MRVNTRNINSTEDVPCILCLRASKVRVTIGDSGLCRCVCVTCFERWLTPLRVDSARASFCFKLKQSKSLPALSRYSSAADSVHQRPSPPPPTTPPLSRLPFQPLSPPPHPRHPGFSPFQVIRSSSPSLFIMITLNVCRLLFDECNEGFNIMNSSFQSNLTRKICIWSRGIVKKASDTALDIWDRLLMVDFVNANGRLCRI